MSETEIAPKRGRGRPRKAGSEAGNSVQSLDRALALLTLVAQRDGLTLSELAETAALAPSTAHRILSTLEAHSFLRHDTESGLWTIGVGAYSVGQAFVRSRRVETLSRPAMWRLMNATGETVNLGVLEGGEAVFLGQVESPAPIRAYFRPGRRGPAYASGIGKALLSQLDEEALRDLYGATALESFTEKTLPDVEGLLLALAETRKRGWALDDEEQTLGMRCIGAPIFDEEARAIAAVSVSGPTMRITTARTEELAARTRATAEEITRAIGGIWPSNSE